MAMDNTEETGLSDGEECGTPWSDLEEINKTTSMGFEELDETNNFWYQLNGFQVETLYRWTQHL